MEHVEVLRHMKETIKAIMQSEVAALDAAIAALSAPQPPAEAQAAGGGEVVAWDNGSPCMESRPIGMVYPAKPAPRASGYLDSSGVEWNAYDTGQMEAYARAAYSDGWAACLRAARESTPPSAPVGVELSALRVQEWLQREYDILPPVQEIEQAMRTPCSCPDTERSLAQQPAAVDDLIRAASAAECGCSLAERESGHRIGCWMPDLRAALAAKQGGSDNDR